jgi:hypothetical protein
MPNERHKEIRRRRQRRKRLGNLKAKLAEAKSVTERERLIDLIKRRQLFFNPDKDK